MVSDCSSCMGGSRGGDIFGTSISAGGGRSCTVEDAWEVSIPDASDDTSLKSISSSLAVFQATALLTELKYDKRSQSSGI